MSRSTGGYGPRPGESPSPAGEGPGAPSPWAAPTGSGAPAPAGAGSGHDEVSVRRAYDRYISGYSAPDRSAGGPGPARSGHGAPPRGGHGSGYGGSARYVSGYATSGARPGGYGPPGYGTPAGPRPIPRPLPPPPEPRGGGFGGVFLCLTIIAVVLAGTIGLGRGILRLDLSGSTAAGSSSSSYQSGGPVAALPVSGPLTHEDALSLQHTVGPALVDVTANLTSQHAVGSGTGIVLSSTGEIMTNNHVIRGASSVKVTDIGNGRTYPATVVGYDAEHDIAVLQARGASGLRTARLGDSDTVQVGDQVAAIGNAGGVGGKPSVATGPVTDLNRTIRTSDELSGSTERLSGLIEANADIQPGDSGGPLVNTSGEVVGVDVAASVDSHTDAPNGTGYAIPINDAMSVVRQIRGGSSDEAVHVGETALLGVSVTGSRNVMAEFGQFDTSPSVTPDGAVVAGVQFDSPAEQAGLQPGDVITSVDGTLVDSASTLTSLVSMHRPGDRLAVTWLEPSGQRHTQTVALAPGPPS